MARQKYQRLSPADIDEIWQRLRSGHSVKPTARALGLPTATVRDYLVRCGGIRPDPRHRAAGRLSLEEREEISRGLAAGLGALEGVDWRLSTRMRGHHAHLLSYGAGVAWATGGWIAFALLRPVPLPVPWLAGPCLLASVAMGFCITAGLPARGNG